MDSMTLPNITPKECRCLAYIGKRSVSVLDVSRTIYEHRKAAQANHDAKKLLKRMANKGFVKEDGGRWTMTPFGARMLVAFAKDFSGYVDEAMKSSTQYFAADTGEAAQMLADWKGDSEPWYWLDRTENHLLDGGR